MTHLGSDSEPTHRSFSLHLDVPLIPWAPVTLCEARSASGPFIAGIFQRGMNKGTYGLHGEKNDLLYVLLDLKGGNHFY